MKGERMTTRARGKLLPSQFWHWTVNAHLKLGVEGKTEDNVCRPGDFQIRAFRVQLQIQGWKRVDISMAGFCVGFLLKQFKEATLWVQKELGDRDSVFLSGRLLLLNN